jgi:hypothetical protein
VKQGGSVPETNANATAPTAALATPAVTSPKKKRKRSVPRQSKSIWKKIPYRAEYQHKPIFRALLSEMLTWPKSYFQKDSEFIQSDMPMSHFICARLIIEAAQGDLGSAREIIDRLEGKPWQKLETTSEENRNVQIGIVYEAPVDQQERYRREAMQAVIDSLPMELQERAQKLMPEKKESRFIDVSSKRLPEKPDAVGIEYIETEPGSAE